MANLNENLAASQRNITNDGLNQHNMTPNEPDPNSILKDAFILLVEDNALLSIDVADMLIGLGAANVYTAASLEAAQTVLASERIDLAMLDVMLGDGNSHQIAQMLLAASIPFLFASGFDNQDSGPEEFLDIPHVKKPFTAEILANAFAQLKDI